MTYPLKAYYTVLRRTDDQKQKTVGPSVGLCEVKLVKSCYCAVKRLVAQDMLGDLII
jgi:hypothetical protein